PRGQAVATEKRGKYWYGDGPSDIRTVLERYSRGGYPAQHFADAACACGGRSFWLSVDDTEGVAIRECAACGQAHPIGDSDEFLEDAELEACECPCGADVFEVTV